MARTPETSPDLAGEKNGQTMLLTTLALLAIGVVAVYSSSMSLGKTEQWYARREVRHIFYAAAAMLVLFTCWRIDYRRFGAGKSLPILAAILLAVALVLAALVLVPGIGQLVRGSRRWIRIGPPSYGLQFQPSEFVKFALVLFLAAWLATRQEKIRSFTATFIPAMCIISLSIALVITQDFGTAVVIGITACIVMLLAGVPVLYLLALIPPAAGAFYFLVMENANRWARITAMFNPDDVYQTKQSLLAIQLGGWFGKGLGCGMQRLGFLPDDSTDFIFAAFCEEWGLVGAGLLMGLFVVWIYVAWRTAARSTNMFGRLLAGGFGVLIALQAVMHIAVAMVVAPPTGMSLPFISAGGTALIIMAAATTMIVSVSSHNDSIPSGW